ncbi:MAG: FkbM family methyltransferase [Pseudomonadota bacterium]
MMRRLKWRLGRKLYCDARGEQTSGDMQRNGEAFLQRCVLANAPTGASLVAFDIGANQGEWTRALLAAAPEALRTPDRLKIHAFEPVPSTADMFTEAVSSQAGADCVTLNRFALSDENGETEIAVYDDGAGTNSLHFSRDPRRPQRTETVPLKTLDQYCAEAQVEHVHLVKCDAEGHDAHVISGAQESLKASRIDVMQFEYNYRWVLSRTFLRDVFEMIDATPYTLGRVDPSSVTLFDTWHFELDRFFQSNYALIHERALDWTPTVRGRFDASNVFATDR